MALAMQAFYGSTNVAETHQKSCALNLMWSKPVFDFRSVFYESYLLGMRNGEIEFSMWILLQHVVIIPIILGRPIGPLLEDCSKMADQMEEFSQFGKLRMTRCYWQMLEKLRTPGIANPSSLDGDITSVGVNKTSGTFQFNEFQLIFFYEDPIVAAERAIENGNSYYDLNFAISDNHLETFHRGLALYVAARHTRKRKYIRHAKGVRSRLKDWQKRGNPNLTYYLMFLNAEQAALDKKYGEAEDLYKKAITFVCRSGYLNHAGLFNELYSDFLRHERQDMAEADYRFEEAIRYYREWGAFGKVAVLEKKKEEVISA